MALPPSKVAELRAEILADPAFLLALLGYQLPWYARLWIRWTLASPRSVNVAPRGAGKSYVMAGLIVWLILRDPNTRILVISKTEDAATDLVRPVRAILESNEVLKQIFGPFVCRREWTDGAFTVAQRTDMTIPEATVETRGIEGQVARTHWNHIFLDDGQDDDRASSEILTDRDWRWLFTTARPTLLRGGGLHLNCTPYSWMDLLCRLEEFRNEATGECMSEVSEAEDFREGPLPPPSARWRILVTPAILRDGTSLDEDRFPLEDRIEDDGTVVEGLNSIAVGPGFESQYLMRRPKKPAAGSRELVFKRSWLVPWERAPVVDRLRVYLYIDPSWISAETAAQRSSRERDPDWFAIAVLGHDASAGVTYVLDIFQDRLSTDEKFKRAAALRSRWKPVAIGCEKTGLQTRFPGAMDFYRGLATAIGQRVIFVQPNAKKIARAEPLAVACSRGRVRWSPELLARPEVIEQMTAFGDPGSTIHDDIPDAVAGAYLLIRGRRGRGGSAVEDRAGGGGEVPGFVAVPRAGAGEIGRGFASVPRR